MPEHWCRALTRLNQTRYRLHWSVLMIKGLAIINTFGGICIGETHSGGFTDKGIEPIKRVDPAVSIVQAVEELVDVVLQVILNWWYIP